MLANLLPAIGAPLAQSGGGEILSPAVVLILCLVAGVGTVLLLPARREGGVTKIGGVILLAAALILVATLVRYAAGTPAGGMGVYFWVFAAIALVGALRVITHPRPVYSALYFVLTVFATAGLFILLWAEFMAAALVLIYAGAILVTYVFVIMLAASASPTGGGDEGVTTNPDDGETSARSPGRLAGLAEYDAVSREPLVAAAVGFTLMGVLLFVIFDRAAAPRLPGPRLDAYSYVATDASGAQITDEIQAGSAAEAQALLAQRGLTDARVTMAGSTEALGRYLFRTQPVNLELAGLVLTLGMIGAIVIARRRIPGTGADATRGGAPEGMTAPATPIDDHPHSIPVYGTRNPRQKAYPET